MIFDAHNTFRKKKEYEDEAKTVKTPDVLSKFGRLIW